MLFPINNLQQIDFIWGYNEINVFQHSASKIKIGVYVILKYGSLRPKTNSVRWY